MMLSGKKSITTKIMYDSFDKIKEKTGEEPLAVFSKALDNVKPVVEVKSRRVGGATYQVPMDIPEGRREALAMRWISLRAVFTANMKDSADTFPLGKKRRL